MQKLTLLCVETALSHLTVQDYNELMKNHINVWKFSCEFLNTVYISAKSKELAVDKYITNYPGKILFQFNLVEGKEGEKGEELIDQYDKDGCIICQEKECDKHGYVKKLTRDDYEKLFERCLRDGTVRFHKISIDFNQG